MSFFGSMSLYRENDCENCVRHLLLIFLWNQGKRQRQVQHLLSSYNLLMKPMQKIKTSAPHCRLPFFFLHCRRWQWVERLVIIFNWFLLGFKRWQWTSWFIVVSWVFSLLCYNNIFNIIFWSLHWGIWSREAFLWIDN